MTSAPANVAVLVSGSGRLLQELMDRAARRALPVRIVVVISSSPTAYGLERARRAGLRTAVISTRTAGSAAARDAQIAALLDEVQADYVVLAGYLAYFQIPPRLAGKVINIHPALLPAFGGKGLWGHHVHEAVLAAGAKVSGCTVHVVDEHYDHGPILLQRMVPVEPGDTPDTLAARVFEQEREALPEALGLLVTGRVSAGGAGASARP